jgi:uncharacterized protein YcfJ
MKKIPGLTTMLLAALMAGNATADRGHHHGWDPRPERGYGRVLHVEPVYRMVEVSVPEQYCSERNVAATATDPDDAALAGAVVGGVVGGVAGNQLGKGKGRAVMTVAGTVLGATIGYQAGPGVAGLVPETQWSYRHCDTVERIESREELLEYRVKYLYRGSIYHARTGRHPGDRIRVDRRARPIHF